MGERGGGGDLIDFVVEPSILERCEEVGDCLTLESEDAGFGEGEDIASVLFGERGYFDTRRRGGVTVGGCESLDLRCDFLEFMFCWR